MNNETEREFYPSLYDRTGDIKDINTLLVPRAALPSQPQGAWNALTDEDRQRAMESMPDMLEGFCKTWGWLHFAKAIEAICREKNLAPPQPTERSAELSEAQVLAAIKDSSAWGKVSLTYESGPYDIDRPTNIAMTFAKAILAAAPKAERTAELEAVQRDAMRYRHLKDYNSSSMMVMKVTGMGDNDYLVLTGGHADAAIDAAIAAEPQKGET